MTALRFFRIAGFAWILVLAYSYSRNATLEREGQTAPGLEVALAVLSVLFLFRAAATEYGRGPEANFQKDLLWGLGSGGLLAVLLPWLPI